jgi:acetylornithine deacetylase/succinyl-diaminopimelate desuccinylase-like protein
MDFRLVPDQQPDDVLRLLRGHLDRHGFEDIEITSLAQLYPAATPPTDPFVFRAAAVAERVAGKPATIVPLSPGGQPVVASLARHVGVPGVSAPDNAVYWGNAAHAPNEHVRLEDIAPAIRYFKALLEDLGTG